MEFPVVKPGAISFALFSRYMFHPLSIQTLVPQRDSNVPYGRRNCRNDLISFRGRYLRPRKGKVENLEPHLRGLRFVLEESKLRSEAVELR